MLEIGGVDDLAGVQHATWLYLKLAMIFKVHRSNL
jgi:hypothetical protein